MRSGMLRKLGIVGMVALGIVAQASAGPARPAPTRIAAACGIGQVPCSCDGVTYVCLSPAVCRHIVCGS